MKIISLITILILQLLLQPFSAFAVDGYDSTFYSLNGIYYYDGLEECISTGGNTSLRGNTNAEKIWNFLIDNGFTEEATAGVMGNFFAESGYEPAKLQNGGPAAGLAQWENYQTQSGRWKNLDDYAKSKNVEWTDLQTQLEWVIKELEGADPTTASILNSNYGGIEGLKKMTDINLAVEAFEKSFERAGIPRWEVRFEAAQDAYVTFKGTASKSPESSSDNTSDQSSTNDDSFMFIGDSLTVGAKDKIIESFPSSSVNAYVGRGINTPGQSGDSVIDYISNNTTGLGSAVVINIGTNDNFPEQSGRKMLDLLQGKKVYLVNNYGMGTYVKYDTINTNISKVAQEFEYVTVLDWKKEVDDNGGREKFYTNESGETYHLNAEGTALYVEFLKKTISGGVSQFSSRCGGGLRDNASIADRAIELSHPEDPNSPSYRFEVTSKQQEALIQTGLVNYGDEWVQKGASCDAFVSMVMSTTVDPEYVKHCCGVANLRDYMANSPEKYEKIPYDNTGSNLRPGDIITAGRGGGANAHIQIYVEIGGQGKIANGGYTRTTGVIEPMNLPIMEGLGEVEVWRWKG